MTVFNVTLQSPDGTETTIECQDDQYILEAAEEAGVELKGGFWETTLNDKKLAVYHGTHESITQALLYCGFYDVVITGHTHVIKNEYVGKTLHLNPGSANGFEETPTIMILDLEIVKVEVISLID